MLACVIDWLTFTMKHKSGHYNSDTEDDIVNRIKKMMIPETMEFSAQGRGWEYGTGRYGYRSAWVYDGIEIMYNGNESICVNMSGQGCRTYESFHDSFDNLILEIVYNKYTVTRLDLAVDDRGQKTTLDIDKIYKASDMRLKADKLSPTCKVWGEFRTTNRIQGSDGTTIYYGSNNSEKRVKIYDKAAEMRIDNEKWVRVELTLKNDYAFSALDLISNGIPAGTVFSGVMRKYLFF